ncbi:MAG: hypothetical protein NC120_08980, partial [Ruminococcus sp.]|nr:hypothetical protein [Ruminococcus sp.]
MKKSFKKIVSALALSAALTLQFTVSVFADSSAVTKPDSFELPEVFEGDIVLPESAVSELPPVTDDDGNYSKIAFADALKTVKELEEDIVPPEVGVRGYYISEEKMSAIAAVVAEDNAVIDGISEPKIKLASYKHSNDYFYNQMTNAERLLYNNIVNACNTLLNSNSNLTSNYISTISYDSSISASRLAQVYWAVYYSNPQFYFLSSAFSYSSSYIAPAVYSDFTMASVRQSTYNNLQNITNTWMNDINKYSSDIDKEKAIYTKLINNITYTSTGGTYHQSIVGALVQGQCVCNGYAMAMVYLCNAAGIDCITVVSSDHAWNRVKLGGVWYEIDVTWMDQGSYVWDIWCNKSEATFHSQDNTYDSGRQSHTISSQVFNQYYSGWTLPSCTSDYNGSSAGKPVITKATPGNGCVSLTWTAVSGATQ